VVALLKAWLGVGVVKSEFWTRFSDRCRDILRIVVSIGRRLEGRWKSLSFRLSQLDITSAAWTGGSCRRF
jgi:hypothetical protein